MKAPARALLVAGVALRAGIALSVPPLVTGDVPIADRGQFELYVGVLYEENGTVEREIPTTEFVLGVSTWQEVTLEVPYVSAGGQQGFGDIVLGTKLLILSETAGRPGLAGSFEVKLASGSQPKGVGTGAPEYGLLLRSQKTLGLFTVMANLGYTFVSEPSENGVPRTRRNVGFAALGLEIGVSEAFHPLAEVYWRSSDTPGEPARVSGDLGFKLAFAQHLSVRAAVGTSLRPESLGGPQIRAYGGLKWDFVVF
jgi:hypothetical protein